MKRLIGLVLLLALALPALAEWKQISVFTNQSVLAQESIVSNFVPVKPYANFWVNCVIESLATGGRCTLSVSVRWRWATRAPGSTTYYYSPWRAILADSLTVHQTLYWAPLTGASSGGLAQDTIVGMATDLQFLVFGRGTNDSTRVARLWLNRLY